MADFLRLVAAASGRAWDQCRPGYVATADIPADRLPPRPAALPSTAPQHGNAPGRPARESLTVTRGSLGVARGSRRVSRGMGETHAWDSRSHAWVCAVWRVGLCGPRAGLWRVSRGIPGVARGTVECGAPAVESGPWVSRVRRAGTVECGAWDCAGPNAVPEVEREPVPPAPPRQEHPGPGLRAPSPLKGEGKPPCQPASPPRTCAVARPLHSRHPPAIQPADSARSPDCIGERPCAT